MQYIEATDTYLSGFIHKIIKKKYNINTENSYTRMKESCYFKIHTGDV